MNAEPTLSNRLREGETERLFAFCSPSFSVASSRLLPNVVLLLFRILLFRISTFAPRAYGRVPCIAEVSMKSRLHLAPPKQRLYAVSGSRIWPMGSPLESVR